MIKPATVFLTLFFPVMVHAQQEQNDSIAYDKLNRFTEFREYLKKSLSMSTTVSSIGTSAICTWIYGSFTMYDNTTLWGLGLAGLGFTVSIFPSYELTKAKKTLISFGFDNIPGNALYRAVTHAQVMSVALTIAGFASASFAIWGIIYQDDIIFSIGLGNVIATTILSTFVPILVSNALKIYDRDAPASLKLGVTNNGIGLVYQFR